MMKRFEVENQTIRLRCEKSPLVIRIVLFLVALLAALFPLAAMASILSDGGQLKPFNFLMLFAFGWLSYFCLKMYLWNSVGQELITITENKVYYVADYGWFKGKVKEYSYTNMDYAYRKVGYDEDQNGNLTFILDHNKETVYTVTKFKIPELKAYLDVLKSPDDTH